ncbi:MAG TPA: hypothetical protein VFS67_15585 [Polyangiaceae bacterium]|nr:hypothetical protein [Polyangiaceae bacterium]
MKLERSRAAGADGALRDGFRLAPGAGCPRPFLRKLPTPHAGRRSDAGPETPPREASSSAPPRAGGTLRASG